jgi:hypothetical protein
MLAAAGLALCAAADASAAPPTLTYDSGIVAPDISGVWEVTEYLPGIRDLDGNMPPLTDAAREQYEINLVERKELPPQDDMTRCVPPGTPRINFAPFPMLVLQTERKITLVYEYHHVLRHIYMDEALPAGEDVNFSYQGDSVGRWDGDTLVVETNGFNDQTYLDREGMPHSPAMRLTERIRLIDDGDGLEIVMTIDDPETFTAPWSTRLVYEAKPDTTLQEYNCWLEYEDF